MIPTVERVEAKNDFRLEVRFRRPSGTKIVQRSSVKSRSPKSRGCGMRETILRIVAGVAWGAMGLSPVFAGGDCTVTDAASGTPVLLQPGPLSIAVSSQTVIFDAGPKGYTAEAAFEFFNSGESTTAIVGFPVYSHRMGDKLAAAHFPAFEAWVDGKSIELKDVPGKRELVPQERNHDFEATEDSRNDWLSGPVSFEGHQRTVMRVKYQAPYSHEVESAGESMIFFLFGIQSAESGSVKSSTFRMKLAPGLCIQRWSASGIIGVNSELRRTGEYEFSYSTGGFALDPHNSGDNTTMEVSVNPFNDDLGCFDGSILESAVDNLRIRNAPSVSAKTTGHLSKDEKVVLVDKSAFTATIDGSQARWYQIVVPDKDKKGWVFGGYIRERKVDAGRKSIVKSFVGQGKP
jgi:hypothetical protein